MIAVLGASGQVGRHVAAGLAERGADACALVRRPVDGLALPTRHADLTDPGSLDTALAGVQRLFLLTPHGPDQDRLERVAIDAARNAGVTRIVKISGGAASLGPNGASTTSTTHWRSEQLIERSGLDFAFLRPSFYAQNLLEALAPQVRATGLLPSPFGAAPIAMVDVRDVAACAVETLLQPGSVNTAWQLTGPRAITMPEVAHHLGVRSLPVPRRVVERAMRRQGADAFAIEHASRMAAYFASGADGATTDHVWCVTGRKPRPVTALLDEHRDAFAPATALARTLTRIPTRG